MPDDVDRSGPDGHCVAERGTTYCPPGASIWELSVQEDVKGKLDGDITKRMSDFGSRAQTLAFVAVTARRYKRKQAWVDQRRQERVWRDVRVLDADDLAQWLEQCPSVATWFAAEHLGRPVRDLVPLKEFLTRWSTWTRPPLPEFLVLAGRRSQVAQVHAWLARKPSELHVRAATREEARVFVAAALAAATPASDAGTQKEEAERWLSRALVVETAEAWRWLFQQATSPMVLIPNFTDVRGLDRRGHYTCIPVDSEGPFPRFDSLDVSDPLPWRDVAQVLQRGAMDEVRALHVASESRGNLGALRRLLGLPELPAWSTGEDRAALAAMLLLGSWHPRFEADHAAVRGLGVEPAALDDLCTRLQSAEERPITMNEGAYTWASPNGAWTALLPLLSEAKLHAFYRVAVTVLAEDDPRYDLPAEERYAAPLHGKSLAHSAALREGIASTLLYLSHYNDAMRARLGSSKPRQVVEAAVNSVLTPEWKRWAGLDQLLQVLAESAPRPFLDRLWESLHTEGGVLQFFLEESHPGYAGTTPHIPLLWALEVLAWDPRTLPQAADCLACLADKDPARTERLTRVANRPLASLAEIFHLAVPQTLETDARRFEILESIAERYPDVGFAIAQKITEQRRGGVLERTCRPRLDDRVPVSFEFPDDEILAARMDRMNRLLLRTAGHDPERWARLLATGVDRLLDEHEANELVNELIARRPDINDPTARIWTVAREELSALYAFHSDLSDDLVRHREYLLRIADSFTPARSIQIHHLFESDALPEPFGFADVEAREARLQELRVAALEELFARNDAEPAVSALIADLSDVQKIGWALSECSRADEYAVKLLDDQPTGPWSRIVAPFTARLFHTKGRDYIWLKDVLVRWVGKGRITDIVTTLLEFWADPRIWDIVDELGAPVWGQYWARVHRVGNHNDPQWERACKNLLSADNRVVAFEVASTRAGQISIDTLMTVLTRLTPEDCGKINSVGYWLEKIFSELDRRIDAPDLHHDSLQNIVRLEIRFVDFLRSSGRPPRYLGVFSNPTFFVDSIALMYRSTEERDESITPERSRMAGNAFRVLSAWKGYPGDDVTDPEARESVLHAWADQVLSLAHKRGLEVAGQIEVANVLARPPAADDGHWPCMAARQLLRLGTYNEFSSHLQIAKRNLRGLTSRSMTEGGTQERVLSANFRRSAEALRVKWPQTAQMLEGLAISYEAEAERFDDEARNRRIFAGHSKDPETRADPAVSVPDGPADESPTPEVTRLAYLEVQGIGPAPSMSISLAPRLNLIAGDNSLGKTFLLDVAWWCLTGTWPEVERERETTVGERGRSRRIALPTTDGRDARIRIRDSDDAMTSSGYDWVHEAWTRPVSWPRTRCPVIYVRVDGGYSVWDPLRNDESLPAYHFSEHTLWNALLGPNDVPICNGLIADWFNWSRGDNKELFEALLRALQELSPSGANAVRPGSSVRLHKHDAREMPTLKFPYGEVPFEHLSAGWKRILGLAYMLVWVWHGHRESAQMQGILPAQSVVILIDEAETHLHPRWQRKLLPAALAAVQALPGTPATQLIVTTHSPMITASIETTFDAQQDTVFHLQLTEAGMVTIEPFAWAKFGDASGWLESPLFGLERAMSEEAERALDAAYAFIRGKTDELPPDLATHEQIDAALRRSVAETNPFWLRWTIFNDTRGEV